MSEESSGARECFLDRSLQLRHLDPAAESVLDVGPHTLWFRWDEVRLAPPASRLATAGPGGLTVAALLAAGVATRAPTCDREPDPADEVRELALVLAGRGLPEQLEDLAGRSGATLTAGVLDWRGRCLAGGGTGKREEI